MSSTSKPTEAEPSKTSETAESPEPVEPVEASKTGPGVIFKLLSLIATAFGTFTEDEMSSITPAFPFRLDHAGPHLTSVAFNGNQFGFFTSLSSDKKFKQDVASKLKEPNAMIFLYANHIMEMNLVLPPSLTDSVKYDTWEKGLKSTKTVDSIDKMVAANIDDFKKCLVEGHENYQGLIRDFISNPVAIRKQWNSPNNESDVASVVQQCLPEGFTLLRNLNLPTCTNAMTGEFDIAVLHENEVIAIIECKQTLNAEEIPKQFRGIEAAKTLGLLLKSGKHVKVRDDAVSIFIAGRLSSNTAHFRNNTLTAFKLPGNVASFRVCEGFLTVIGNVANFVQGVNLDYAKSNIFKFTPDKES